jgi:hypothetical protein
MKAMQPLRIVLSAQVVVIQALLVMATHVLHALLVITVQPLAQQITLIVMHVLLDITVLR